ncbi:inorganic polyphosphate/ATP-NAD kinase [Mycoplasmoides genitalium M6320]|uniref:NAD kinase n=1 Tax=Mycoplasmoides genitalium M6320 TaxID=662945 RepID=A0ABC7ZJ94_MYCGT|nr:NAD(+) kinase [Mycoplasmoides genitalium]AFQ03935.1 inorganic polyphosphate/ATP-NAD kinase [Mycoplasmoides genitalium M6320]
MKYKIFASTTPQTEPVLNKLRAVLKTWQAVENGYEYVFVLGGDGFFVSTLANYNCDSCKVVGINTGHIGFYTSFNGDDLDENFISKLTSFEFRKINLLEVKTKNHSFLVLNELAVYTNTAYPINIFIDDNHWESYRGSGLLIVPRTGSTALAKSAKGAVIFPNVDVVQIIELNPLLHPNQITIQSPIILPMQTKVEFRIKKAFKAEQFPNFYADGIKLDLKNEDTSISFQLVLSRSMFHASLKTKDFIDKLKSTFIKQS